MYACLSIFHLSIPNIYVEGLIFSRPLIVSMLFAGTVFPDPPRGTRGTVVVIEVVFPLT